MMLQHFLSDIQVASAVATLLLLFLLFTRPLPRDGGMAEDHGASEAGQLPRVWTRGRRESESRQTVTTFVAVHGFLYHVCSAKFLCKV